MDYFKYKNIKEIIEYLKSTASELKDVEYAIRNDNTDRYTAEDVSQIECDLQTKLNELEQTIETIRR